MGINAQRANGTVIAKADGRIDSSNSREFHSDLETVVAESDTALVLDFEDVSYISSAGMRVILLAARNHTEVRHEVCSLFNERFSS